MPTVDLELADLIHILRECAGVDEGVDLTGDILDTMFTELGYDSLALLEAASRVEREVGVKLSDDAVAAADTPRALLRLVNHPMSAAV